VTLRSKDPELIEQEIWAHLIVHTVITRLLTALAQTEEIDPDRLSFTNALEQLRLAVTRRPRATDPDAQAPEAAPAAALAHSPFVRAMATRLKRLLDNGTKRLRTSKRQVSRPQNHHHPPQAHSYLSQATALGGRPSEGGVVTSATRAC
jgi:hypothetical protein